MEQIIKLDKEIESIERTIRLRAVEPSDVILAYKDYRTGKGIPKAEPARDNGEEMIRIYQQRLERKQRQLRHRIEQAEAFIQDVQDSSMRTILREIYLNGSSQQEVADMLHYTQQRISQILATFWEAQSRKRK